MRWIFNNLAAGRSIMLAAICAYTLPAALFLLLADTQAVVLARDIIYFLYVSVTGALFGYAAYRTRQSERSLYAAWRLLALALLLLPLAMIFAMYQGHLQGESVRLSMTAPPLLISNLFFLIGLYRIPQVKQTRLQTVRQLMDTATIYVGAFLLLWISWINPLMARGAIDMERFYVLLLSLAVHLTLILGVTWPLFCAQPIQPRRPLFLLLAAALALFASDLVIAVQEPMTRHQPGGLIDYLRIASLIFACVAAVLQVEAVATESTVTRWQGWRVRYMGLVQVALPPILLLVTLAVMLFTHHEFSSGLSYSVTVGIGLMFILVSIRQVLTIWENADLTSALRKELLERQHTQMELQEANETLEQHVIERTKELLLANEQLRENESKLRFDAFHDKLTGLPNRAAFIHHLESALQVSQQDRSYRFAVLFLDFDGFKVVNDSLGHWLGDELLIALAHRLRDEVPIGNLVARLGGDEFLVLLEHFLDDDEPLEIAERIQQKLRRPFEIRDYRLHTSASIGVVLKDEFHTSAGDILRDADIAMYQAKENGKARCVLFDTTMRAQAVARLKLETELRTALSNHELHLAYQPVCNVSDRQVTGFEALARWQHREHGFVSPAEFIPIAEETGLIIPLGEWVLEEACRQLVAWQSHYPQLGDLTISVNISAQQLYQGHLTTVVSRILNEVGLAPNALKLEITESIFMEDVESAIATFTELRKLGVQIQIDDFGTGYSSFNYLHRLPIDTLKIDKSFIDLLHLGGQHVEIVRTIANLAHNLQLSVIAEGVESEAQFTYVRELACEQVQGYLFSKPLLTDAAEHFIRSSLAGKTVTITTSNATRTTWPRLPAPTLTG